MSLPHMDTENSDDHKYIGLYLNALQKWEGNERNEWESYKLDGSHMHGVEQKTSYTHII